jgi:nickel-dependent lactate racemase
MTVNIALVSELKWSDVERMRMRPSASFEQAYRMATENLRKDFTTYIVPDASSTLLLTEQERASALASISGDIRREDRKVS